MPPENQTNEFDKFFGDLPTEDQRIADVFDEEPKPKEEDETPLAEGPVPAKAAEEPRKNRHHRRLETRLAKSEELRIAAETRANVLAEIGPRAKELNVDERLVRMYGPENTEAARLHMELLTDYAARAETEAIRKIEERNAVAAQEAREFETLIERELEAIEDEHDIDVTSDAPAARKARRELLELVEKLSPKNSEGLVTAYADFGEVYDLYTQAQTKPEKPAARAKEIAARSMESGAVGLPPAPEATPGFRGWMKDFNVY